MNKLPFVSMFSQRAMGLSINGNDLVITTVCRKLVKYTHETFKIKDFILKDTTQLNPSIIQREKFVEEIILSLPRELAIVREIDYPHSNLKELREALGYQLDSFIPFKNEDVYFDIHPVSQARHETKVLIVAVKKPELDNILLKLQALEITPSRVIISPFAFLPILEEKKGTVVLASKNTSNYSYNLFENSHLVYPLLQKLRLN